LSGLRRRCYLCVTSVLFLSETGWLWTAVMPLIYCTLAKLKRLRELQARAVPLGIEHQSTFALLTLSGKQGAFSFRLESWEICRVGSFSSISLCTTRRSNMKVNFKLKTESFHRNFGRYPSPSFAFYNLMGSRSAFNPVAVC